MYLFVLLLSLLSQVNTSPTPEHQLPSIFNDPSIPVLDHLDLALFNLTVPIKGAHPRATDSNFEKRTFNLNYVLCNIVLDGRNQGNPAGFRNTGQILLTTGVPTSPTINGRNPTDVVIASGNPIAFPLAGALRYTTNRYLNKFIGGSQIQLFNTAYDFAYVSSTARSVTVQVDTRTANLNAYSVFNLNTGVQYPAFNVISGGFTINIATNNAVSGTVSFVGNSFLTAGRQPYHAVISGTVVGRGTAAF